MSDLKVVTVQAVFPELPGGRANQQGRGTGTSTKVALARAFANLLKQPKLKGRRFNQINAVISIGTIKADTEEETQVEAEAQ